MTPASLLLPLLFIGASIVPTDDTAVFQVGGAQSRFGGGGGTIFPIIVGPPIGGYHAETIDFQNRVIAAGGFLTPLMLTEYDVVVRNAIANGWRDNQARFNLETATNLAGCSVPLFISTNFGGTVFGFSNDVMTGFVEGDYSTNGGVVKNANADFINTGVIPTTLPTWMVSFQGIGVGNELNSSPFGARSSAGGPRFEAIINSSGNMTMMSRVGGDEVTGQFATTLTNSQVIGVYQHSANGTSYVYSAAGNMGELAFVYPVAAYALYTNAIFVMDVGGNGGASIGAPADGFRGACGFYSIGTEMTPAEIASMITAVSNFHSKFGRPAQ